MLQHANILSNELSRYHQIFSISNYGGTVIEESFCHVNVPRGRRSNQPWSMVELPCPRTKRCWRTGCQDGSQSFLSHSHKLEGFSVFSLFHLPSNIPRIKDALHNSSRVRGYEEYPASVKVLQFLLLAEWCCWWWLPAGFSKQFAYIFNCCLKLWRNLIWPKLSCSSVNLEMEREEMKIKEVLLHCWWFRNPKQPPGMEIKPSR